MAKTKEEILAKAREWKAQNKERCKGLNMKFKQFVKIKSGFYAGRRGRLIRCGESKFLVRFRIGLFRVIDVWFLAEEFE
jgi:hypothetical protein